jgi:hypothetical protein
MSRLNCHFSLLQTEIMNTIITIAILLFLILLIEILKLKFFERVWENFCSQKFSQISSSSLPFPQGPYPYIAHPE